MSASGKSESSVGFGGLLFVVFLVLKLCGVIDWSWWWVTAPLWVPIGIVLLIIAIVLLIIAIVLVIAIGKGKK